MLLRHKNLGIGLKRNRRRTHATAISKLNHEITMNESSIMLSQPKPSVNGGRPIINLSGLVFRKLKAIDLAGITKTGHTVWNCVCDCGNNCIAYSSELKRGGKGSCGCLAKEPRNFTHKMSYSPEFKCWSRMKARCLNKNHDMFKHYGGRGIKVCGRWINSFENFFLDMGNKPSSKHTIERTNNNGNYEPSNCRWALNSEQQNNTRKNVFIEHLGLKLTVSQWSRKTGIGISTITYRFKKGWSVEEILETAITANKQRFKK